MQFRIDKKSGLKLSVLGFGCMRFPRNLSAIDMQRTESLIMDAINGGVNYFDTAYIYPGSEDALGIILEKNQARKWVYIATKLPLVLCREPEDFDKFFNKQLERLRTDYIDYYLMHMITDIKLWEKFKSWGVEKWIEEKKKSGQIKQIGFSFHGSQAEFLKILDAYPWEFCQIQYNYLEKNFQAGITGLNKAAETMPVIIMEPLLGGKLATGLPQKALDIFKKANPNLTPVGWAFRWIWDNKEATVLLSGMNDKKQLQENLELADKAIPQQLTEDEHKAYHEVLKVIGSTYKVHCTYCNYCMPCPKGVNIPGVFAAYNSSFSMGFVSGMHQYATSTALFTGRSGSPVNCTKCKACELKCPQRVPVIQSLTNVKRRMEPFWMNILVKIVGAFLKWKSKARN